MYIYTTFLNNIIHNLNPLLEKKSLATKIIQKLTTRKHLFKMYVYEI